MTGGHGPLAGVRVVHLASLGPGPYGVMLLADMGADVVIVDRVPGLKGSMPAGVDPRRRGQRSIALDLKSAAGREVLLDLTRTADVLIEGMRPGVAEKLGVGPDDLQSQNERLIYARMTGWGQGGPLAADAGHDINYVAATGALLAMGEPDAPPPVPLNLLGDYAGGGAFLVIAVLAALWERQSSGRGTVIDAAIVDGVTSLTTPMMGMAASGLWAERGTNAFDGSRPWYRCYETADGRYVAVGAVEPAFYTALLERLDLDPAQWVRDDQLDVDALARAIAGRFRAADRGHWTAVFAGSDACVSPVLDLEEARMTEAAVARRAYVEIDGVVQPAPLPRVVGRESALPAAPPSEGRDTIAILSELGRDSAAITALIDAGAARSGGAR